MFEAAFVSCDIVGHSAEKSVDVQRRRIAQINEIVARQLGVVGPCGVWASGGDGGHIAFRDPAGALDAVRTLRELHHWSCAEDVPLKICAHVGEVDQIVGADGRTQLIGDGINYSGRLLASSTRDAVVVSDAFKVACMALDEADRPELAGTFQLFLKTFGLQRVHHLRLARNGPSAQPPVSHSDRAAMTAAIEAGDAWHAIYFAKRVLQRNAYDQDAELLLERLGSHELTYPETGKIVDRAKTVANPFFAPLDADSRVEVIRFAQLVERRQGERICEEGEAGDAMFVLLHGEVGVFLADEDADGLAHDPVAIVRQGAVVGELAFALQRPRTATLLALKDAALLAISVDSLRSLLQEHPLVSASLDRFVTSRALEWLSHNSPILLGRDGDGPLAALAAERPWERILRYASRVVWPASAAQPMSLAHPEFERSGLYFLVAGTLRSCAYPEKTLTGDTQDLVYADLPGWLSLPNHEYRAEGGDATLLHLGADAFFGRHAIVADVARALRREIAQRAYFFYDVFISYTFDDHELALAWRDRLEASGLRVYMEQSKTGHYFRERIQSAVIESLTFVALVSAQTMARPFSENWVRLEIEFRTAAFEPTTARIFPVRLPGGRPEVLADGYTVIEATGRMEAAMEELVAGVRAVKDGSIDPPYSLSRKSSLRLGGRQD